MDEGEEDAWMKGEEDAWMKGEELILLLSLENALFF